MANGVIRTCLALLLAFSFCGCDRPASEDDSRSIAEAKVAVRTATPFCDHYNKDRQAFFGDLHVHTALSIDAYRQSVETMPEDAYAFAQGEIIKFHDARVRIDRPLDFAAVTDHAEFLGELGRCSNADDDMYHSYVCDTVRTGSGAANLILENAFAASTADSEERRAMDALKVLFESEELTINEELCGADGSQCMAAERTGWNTIIDAAESAYDRTAECTFTSFIGYEYSGVKIGSNYHRNVIFAGAQVPDRPVSYLDAPFDYLLWEQLEESCRRSTPGCDYISIPHNPNLSNGKLLTPNYEPAQSGADQKVLAQLRQQAEPLVEIFQHKGQSECINGVPGINAEYDALCDIEQVREIGGSTEMLGVDIPTPDCGASSGDGGMIDIGCISRNDYLRGALLTGLREEQRLGINPLKMGVIASTDTHESTPGSVDEEFWPGHVGRELLLADKLQLKAGLPYRLLGSPGGLAGVWAEENTRESLFAALRRRETFGTSGPRIKPRLFADWSVDRAACEDNAAARKVFQEAAPMGGDIHQADDNNANPQFLAIAERDPQSNQLQRLQLIKGWIDAAGKSHVSVTDIAGDYSQSASVDLQTGEESGPGFDRLCVVVTDQDFDPNESAYYYLRVVENPSLRWSWAQCIALPEEDRPSACTNSAPKTLQEMAWTSPIWYQRVESPELAELHGEDVH